MAITAADLELRLSGGAGNTSPAASLGGARSTAAGGVIQDGVAGNLFDDTTGDQAAAGRVEYRGFYVRNAHGSLTLIGPVLWLPALTSSPDTEFDVALAAEGVNTPMAAIADETTAPTGVVFSRPTTKGGGLAIGDLPPGQARGVWIRRTVSAGAAAANDTGSVRFEGDTNP